MKNSLYDVYLGNEKIRSNLKEKDSKLVYQSLKAGQELKKIRGLSYQKVRRQKVLSQLQIANEALGWIPPFDKIIDGKKYQLFDALYVKDKQQMFDYENQIQPLIKSRYKSYRTIIREDTLAIYVMK